MRFADWEPHYTAILEYFGFEREEDEAAARLLADLADRDDVGLLEALIRDRTVTVCGNAPSLPEELDRIEGTVLAADAAAEVLADHGIRPDAVFTDLDGATDVFIDLSEQGTVMVVHAHGDNVPLLRHWVPRITGPLVATTQAAPLAHVHNFGGFTDGDRAVFAADELGAARIWIVGFDLADKNVDPLKRGKLYWAGELLRLIGYDL
ncbi:MULTISPECIES: 6-hydroxymethylpterin diphosphokinase MptE-like protein [unclassified Methanoculleus]|uniref:6-hydroxymethylpterin diphosphokinase MptE-like protein n=1 Tax=unclassified Methanoculleus TaxID=2619537 RepID=UPI0025D0E818|nr:MULTISPECIES: 6-hydroxymethylpterin diphosphokinase MptE-like protein [unclassified Methanoculleus]